MTLTSHQKGRIGEMKVSLYFMSQGYEVYSPFGDGTSCDMIILDPLTREIYRVEVKTTDAVNRYGTVTAFLGKVRTNSTRRIKSGFISSNSDKLAIYSIALDKVFVFDSKNLEGVYNLTVK